MSKNFGEIFRLESEDIIDCYKEINLSFLPNGRPERELPAVIGDSTARVVVLGDVHNDPRIRRVLSYPVAIKLRELGFTHYAIEAPQDIQPTLDTLGKGQMVNLYNNPKIGPGSFADRTFADAVYAMAGAGMKVIALDDERNFNGGEISVKERGEKLYEKLLYLLKEEKSRVLVLIGERHAILGEVYQGVPSLASRLIASGIHTMVVRFTN